MGAPGMMDHARCMMLSAPTAEARLKYLSSQQRAGPYTAGTASRSTSRRTDINRLPSFFFSFRFSYPFCSEPAKGHDPKHPVSRIGALDWPAKTK